MIAFQKVQGLDRTGGVGPALWSALDTPKLPHLRYPGQGDHLEVDKTLQVLLVAHAGKVAWISPVSTGGPGKYTPEGTYTVQRKVPGFDPSPLGVLWDPLYFTGGYAVHGNPSVPAYPASHGCVRLPMEFAKKLFEVTPMGGTVVIAGGHEDPVKRPAAGVLAPAMAGVTPAPAEVLTPEGTYTWNPAASASGPVSIIISTGDQQVVVLRNGVEIGRAHADVQQETSETQVMTLAPGKEKQWIQRNIRGTRRPRGWCSSPSARATTSSRPT